MSKIRTVEDAIERLYALNVGAIGSGSSRHERPHKPLLLLAALDLVASGKAKADRVPWSPELRERFTQYFEVVRRNNDQNTPENPFFYLRGDGFWEPLETSSGSERPLPTTPTAMEAKAGTVFARFTDGMEAIVQVPEYRASLRDALVSRYFPTLRAEITPLFAEPTYGAKHDANAARCNEAETAEPRPGRDSAFRKLVLKAYDFQCVACGLRIKLPETDISIVDGAHIVPFEVDANDNPTNGLALCKNHHWAMDRFLIVPTPERIWKVSPKLQARRSPGEEALVALNGQQLLPPHEDAFQPDLAGLAWRAERLYA